MVEICIWDEDDGGRWVLEYVRWEIGMEKKTCRGRRSSAASCVWDLGVRAVRWAAGRSSVRERRGGGR